MFTYCVGTKLFLPYLIELISLLILIRSKSYVTLEASGPINDDALVCEVATIRACRGETPPSSCRPAALGMAPIFSGTPTPPQVLSRSQVTPRNPKD